MLVKGDTGCGEEPIWGKLITTLLSLEPRSTQSQLEQLECLRSEDTPRRPMITHTIDQFILNPKSILLTSSYQIPNQSKVKAEKLEKFAGKLKFCYKLNMGHTL